MAEEGSWGLTHRCLNLPRLLVKCKRKRALKKGQFCSIQIYFEFIIRSRCSFPGEIKKREDFSPIWAAINLSLQRPGVHPDNYTSYMSFNFDQILKLKYLSIPFCLIFRGWVFPQTINIIIIFNFVQKRWNTCWKKNLLVDCMASWRANQHHDVSSSQTVQSGLRLLLVNESLIELQEASSQFETQNHRFESLIEITWTFVKEEE